MKRTILSALFSLVVFSAMAVTQEPLYVVNNRVVSKEAFEKISTQDIESITVLKSDLEEYVSLGDVSNGVVLITLRENNEEALPRAEVMPTFMGGDLNTFVSWVYQNVRYPAEAIEKKLEGRVIVKFIVGKDGYINQSRLHFFDKCGAIFHDEVIRVFSKAPQWTPAMQDGEPVAVTFTMPIVFKLSGDAEQPAE